MTKLGDHGIPLYGVSAKENNSHNVTPKDHTSDLTENSKSLSDSIAIQRHGKGSCCDSPYEFYLMMNTFTGNNNSLPFLSFCKHNMCRDYETAQNRIF